MEYKIKLGVRLKESIKNVIDSNVKADSSVYNGLVEFYRKYILNASGVVVSDFTDAIRNTSMELNQSNFMDLVWMNSYEDVEYTASFTVTVKTREDVNRFTKYLKENIFPDYFSLNG